MTCKGMNCTYDPPEINDHSLECEAQHAAAIAGGTFVMWSASQGGQASKQVALTDAQAIHLLQKMHGLGVLLKSDMKTVRAVEAAHGICAIEVRIKDKL